MGDPCGIGPEIILKALKSSYSNSLNEFLVIGSYYAMSTVNQNLSINMPVKKINQFDDFDPNETTMIQILDPENIDAEYIQPGVLSKEAGKACMEWVEIAAHLCLENKIQGILDKYCKFLPIEIKFGTKTKRTYGIVTIYYK